MRLNKDHSGGLGIIAAFIVVLLVGAGAYFLVIAPSNTDKANQETQLPGVTTDNTIGYIIPLLGVKQLYIDDHQWQDTYTIDSTHQLQVFTPSGANDTPTVSPNDFSAVGAHDLRLWIGITGPGNISSYKSFDFSKTDVQAALNHDLTINCGYFAISQAGNYTVSVIFFEHQTSGAWAQQGPTVTMPITITLG